MRVALVLEHFDPRRGGTEKWTCRFIPALQARGIEVHVAACDRGPGTPSRVRFHPFERSRSPWKRAENAAAAAQAIGADVVHDMGIGWQCDVLHPHGGAWEMAFEANLHKLPAWLRPWKRWFSRYAPRYRAFRRLAEHQYRPDGPKVLAVSPRTARHLADVYGVDSERLRMVGNGVDVDRFHPQHRAVFRTEVRRAWDAGDRKVLLLAAHNFRLKGGAIALDALAKLAEQGRRDFLLVVVGREPPAPFRRMAEKLGIASQVRFAGHHEDMRTAFAAADVFLHPTFYDPCSLVTLEALASGLPVVTTTANGAAAWMADGREGVVLSDPFDVGALAAGVLRVADQLHARPWGADARALAERHAWEQNVEGVLAVYDEVLAARGARRREIPRPRPQMLRAA